MCTSLNVLAHKTGNPKSPMNPQVSDLSDSGLSFLLLSEFWPHFSFSPMQLACLCAEDAGGLWPEAPGFHHPTSAASGVEPLSPIAPGEEEPPDPGPGHGATVTRPVCAHPGDLGLEGSGRWPHQRRKEQEGACARGRESDSADEGGTLGRPRQQMSTPATPLPHDEMRAGAWAATLGQRLPFGQTRWA